MQHRKDNYTGNTRLHERKCAEQRRRRSDIGSLIVSKERQESRNRKWKTRRITWERRLFFVPSWRNFTKELHETTSRKNRILDQFENLQWELCCLLMCLCCSQSDRQRGSEKRSHPKHGKHEHQNKKECMEFTTTTTKREAESKKHQRDSVCVYTAVVAKLQWIRGNKRTVVSGRKKEKKSSSWKVVVTRRWWWRWRRGKIFLLPLLVSLLRRQEVDF